MTAVPALSAHQPRAFQKNRFLKAIMLLTSVWMAGFLLAPVRAASATGAGIDDKAGFFSEKAKAEADALISQTAAKLRKDLRIDTFSEIPETVRTGVNLQDKAAAAQMYEKWARREAVARKVHGVYVLVVKNPAHLHVEIDKDTVQKAFTLADRNSLVGLMVGKLRDKKFDEALLEGTRFVTNQMVRHAGERPRFASTEDSSLFASKTSGFGWLPTLIIVVIVGMIILRVIGGIFSAAAGGGSPLGGAPSGGGFFRSLMGGLFGAAAGMWLYDHFFGHSGGTSAFGSEGDSGSPFGNTSADYTESDYSGSGADFGEDNSGSDFGSGGGDFGSSGDFGSGGSDFGD
jgi:uncharacterized protein